MFLDTDNSTAVSTARPHLERLFSPWADCPHTSVHHHGTACCERAKTWLLCMDFSLLGIHSPLHGPRWIRERYKWGPSQHPVYWCDAVQQKELDCGVLAAMAHECFAARGIESYPVQLVQQYSSAATAHWKQQWEVADASTAWIGSEFIYHEAVAVVLPSQGDAETRELKIWDASAACWLNPLSTSGYGSVVALRVCGSSAAPYQWGSHFISSGEWLELNDARRELSGLQA